MKCIKITVLFLVFRIVVIAQIIKPAIDTSTFDKWPDISSPAICDNGGYIFYVVNRISGENCRLIVKSTTGDWEEQFVGGQNASFMPGSRFLIFKIPGDSLAVLKLGTKNITYFQNVSDYKLSESEKSEWVAFKMNSPERTVVLYNIINQRKLQYISVLDYLFNKQGTVLLLQFAINVDSCQRQALQVVSLPNGEAQQIWNGSKSDFYSFDTSGKKLVFLSNVMKDGVLYSELWYYREGMAKAVLYVNNQSVGIDSNLTISDFPPQFNQPGDQVFFRLQSIKAKGNKDGNQAGVDIWSYSDIVVQPLQLIESGRPNYYMAVVNAKDRKVIRLEQKEGELNSLNLDNDADFLLFKESIGEPTELRLKRVFHPSVWLISTRSGIKKELNKPLRNNLTQVSLSPNHKWIIFYDSNKKSYFSYETATGLVRNITKGIEVDWINEDLKDRPGAQVNTLNWSPGQKTWLYDDSHVLIYDNYDIWQIDPACNYPPLNITNGYGRAHHIQYRILYEDNSFRFPTKDVRSHVILRAFNKNTKDNGFYRIELGVSRDPELLTMGPFIYYWPGIVFDDFCPIKAKYANVFLVRRMNSMTFPNYFISHDFRDFLTVSDLQPQRKYNWLTSQLIHWKTTNGKSATGVLYKPENFDFKKKYPIIFDIYEKRSNELNIFWKPRAFESRLNIPWFVSRGYLVFVPDIYYEVGEIGRSVVNSIVSAANHLGEMPWVDKKKMGIQGHSFGGYETNYVVSHSNIFAAACSAASISDLISLYGTSLEELGRTNFFIYWCERGQGRMNASLWQRPDLYINNSPIFRADKVTTPLLMMANKRDNNVPFSQSVEFFMGLRRLGKKTWLLQYDRGYHGVNGKDALDYTIRMSQFFDHYLKDTSPPKWMTEGVSAKLKGIDSGFELDQSGKQP